MRARSSHQDSSRGGADGRGYKARDEEPRRHTRQYVEEPGEAQRSRYARIRRRSRRLVRRAGYRAKQSLGEEEINELIETSRRNPAGESPARSKP
jgi:hypothetical protein